MNNYLKLEKEIREAIYHNDSAVDKLLKYEKREWVDRIPAQQEVCRSARERLYKAWDAIREQALREEENDTTF